MSENEMAKLRWRCRRGMKELDQLMLRYLDLYYADATEAHQNAFKQLLDYEEPDLYGYFSGRLVAEEGDLGDVIKAIQSSPAINYS